jgi:hypothetical protein
MSRFLPPKTTGSMGIAVCDRCGTKVYLDALKPDGNSPGLRVCGDAGCWDTKDPWRLPARKTENIALPYPRPDSDVSIALADVTVIL